MPPILTHGSFLDESVGSRASASCQQRLNRATAGNVQISFGHFSLTGISLYVSWYDWMASTMAMAAMYCRKTMGRRVTRKAGWLMTVENISIPGGAIQALLPRPRPAICVVAANVKPVETSEMSLKFLQAPLLGIRHCNDALLDLLFEDGVCARYHLPIQQQVSPVFSLGFHCSVTLEHVEEEMMIELRCATGCWRLPFVWNNHPRRFAFAFSSVTFPWLGFGLWQRVL